MFTTRDTSVWFSRWTVNKQIGYGQDSRGAGIRFPAEARDFLFSMTSRPPLGPTQPPIQWEAMGVLLGVKWPGREADCSPPTSAEVENGGAIPPLTHTFSWRGA
jgi:hypothetical protein